jgi:hypothetical protein
MGWFSHHLRMFTALVALAACSDSTGNEPLVPPPGVRLLGRAEYMHWKWLPGGAEIMFTTRYGPGGTKAPTRLEAINVTTGLRRVVVPPLDNGRAISPFSLSIAGDYVYFVAQTNVGGTTRDTIYRTRLDGSGNPERVLTSPQELFNASRDGTRIAEIDRSTVVVRDVASGAQRAITLPSYGSRVTWSPTGATLVVDVPGTSIPTFHVVDVASGNVASWTGSVHDFSFRSLREFDWQGETPVLHVLGHQVFRVALPGGTPESLATLAGSIYPIGWSSTRESVVITSAECLEYGREPGDRAECITWRSVVERVILSTGARIAFASHESMLPIEGIPAPTGVRMAYESWLCVCPPPATGLFVLETP